MSTKRSRSSSPSRSHSVPRNHTIPTEPFRILALPVDLIRLIFSFCPTCALTSVLPRVCKKFRLLALEGVTCITFSTTISSQRAEFIFSLLPNLTQLKIGDLIGPLDAPFRLPTLLRSLTLYRDAHFGTPREAVSVPSSPSLSSLTSLHIEHKKVEGEVASMLQTCSFLTLLALTTFGHRPGANFPFFPALHSLSITGILSAPHGTLIASHASQLDVCWEDTLSG